MYLLYYLYTQKPMEWIKGRSRLHRENDKASDNDKRGGRGIVYRGRQDSLPFFMEYFRKCTSKNRYLEEKILQQEQKEGDTSLCRKSTIKHAWFGIKRKN